MKLIIETIEDASFLVEEKAGQEKTYMIEGVFLQSEIKNRNGRIYRSEIMDREVDRYIREYVNENRAHGELGHPTGPTINLDRASHRIVSLVKEGNNYIGKARINKNPMGMIVRNLLDDGSKLGVSSRGLGTVKTTNEGIDEVQDDFWLATAADIVADPSAPDAFVRGIMESKEFWFEPKGGWRVEDAEILQENLKKAKTQQIEEEKMHVFESFLKKVAQNYTL